MGFHYIEENSITIGKPSGTEIKPVYINMTRISRYINYLLFNHFRSIIKNLRGKITAQNLTVFVIIKSIKQKNIIEQIIVISSIIGHLINPENIRLKIADYSLNILSLCLNIIITFCAIIIISAVIGQIILYHTDGILGKGSKYNSPKHYQKNINLFHSSLFF